MQSGLGTRLPWSTLVVNVLGCLVAGILFGLFESRWAFSGEARVIVLIGFMGAFTTFSSYMLETSELARDAQWIAAAGNMLLQNGLGAVALYVGLVAAAARVGGGRMHLPENAELLRIFIGDSDRYHHKPLYEAIVETAREHQLAGATVLRGYLGFGAHSRIHTAKILRLSEDLPIVVEIVDAPEQDRGLPAGARRDDGRGHGDGRAGARAHVPARRRSRRRLKRRLTAATPTLGPGLNTIRDHGVR